MLVALIAVGAALLWLLLFSGFSWRARLLAVLALLSLVALSGALFQLHGFSGDLRPQFRWRFARRAALDPSSVPAGEIGDRTKQVSPRIPPERDDARDFPQFLGPTRNGVCPWEDFALDCNWVEHPPAEIWRVATGAGWSGFAVVGHTAVTQEQRGEIECVVCRDLLSGATLWVHEDRAAYRSAVAGDGPRATPSIADGVVYTVGSTGLLNALDLATGRSLWSHDIVAENHADVPEWGLSTSPLVVLDRVVVCAGGEQGAALVAYDARSGEKRWSSGSDKAGYSSPALLDLCGAMQIVNFSHSAASGHLPENGQVLWTVPWSRKQPNVAQPLRVGENSIVLSSGYGVGASCLEIVVDANGRFSTRERWRSVRLKAKMSNMVTKEGCIYGFDDGALVCVDAGSGERQWKGERLGHGQMLLAGEMLLVQSEDGELLLVAAGPTEYRELARHRLFDGKLWNPPALAGGILLSRTDSQAVALKLPTLRSGERNR